MATWQYTMKMFPRQGVIKHYGKEPDTVNQSELEDANIWNGTNIIEDLKLELEKCLPPVKSWSSDIDQFGSLEESCIEIFYESGNISEISIRLDLRHLEKDQLEFLLACSSKFDLVIYDHENGGRINSMNSFGSRIRSSSAYSFVKDPLKFLDALKTN